MSHLRASCSALARFEPEATRKDAEGAYKKLVKALETVDFAVQQREKGKQPEVLKLMREVEQRFDGFLNIVGGNE